MKREDNIQGVVTTTIVKTMVMEEGHTTIEGSHFKLNKN
jgi:hypothetical protein